MIFDDDVVTAVVTAVTADVVFIIVVAVEVLVTRGCGASFPTIEAVVTLHNGGSDKAVMTAVKA